jgi:uncharacterized protein (TIGR02757 family)
MAVPVRGVLEQLYQQYHKAEFLPSDPLEFPHRYQDPWDQEAVALLSGLLAYGNVKQIRRSVELALERMARVAPSPRAFVERVVDEPELGRRAFRGYVHRFNVGKDLVALFILLGMSWRTYGSLGAHFLKFLGPEDRHIGNALDGLITEWRSWNREKSPSFSYLLTAPTDGSCCKRWCMFLRWMGRAPDGLDLGLWTGAPDPTRKAYYRTFPAGRVLRADQLVIPLDTHTGRISQYIGLTRRKSLNWLAAVEVTDSLRASDPADPTKYDFALARLGILDICQRKYRAEICQKCDLLRICQFAISKSRALV